LLLPYHFLPESQLKLIRSQVSNVLKMIHVVNFKVVRVEHQASASDESPSSTKESSNQSVKLIQQRSGVLRSRFSSAVLSFNPLSKLANGSKVVPDNLDADLQKRTSHLDSVEPSPQSTQLLEDEEQKEHSTLRSKKPSSMSFYLPTLEEEGDSSPTPPGQTVSAPVLQKGAKNSRQRFRTQTERSPPPGGAFYSRKAVPVEPLDSRRTSLATGMSIFFDTPGGEGASLVQSPTGAASRRRSSHFGPADSHPHVQSEIGAQSLNSAVALRQATGILQINLEKYISPQLCLLISEHHKSYSHKSTLQ
jgi:hypothetical protein